LMCSLELELLCPVGRFERAQFRIHHSELSNSLWKRNSANFALTEFSEVRIAPVQYPRPPGRRTEDVVAWDVRRVRANKENECLGTLSGCCGRWWTRRWPKSKP
jgi:hypothetical protein